MSYNMDKIQIKEPKNNADLLSCKRNSQLLSSIPSTTCLQSHTSLQARNSGVELYKIIAMLMIVLFHTVHTLSTYPTIVFGSQNSAINLGASTNNAQKLVLSMISYFGNIGNTAFFVCSAWYLIRKNNCDKMKIFQMMLDIWIVSVGVLLLFAYKKPEVLSGSIVLKMMFPSLFALNWYLTCYMIFYALSPFLNFIIRKVSQKTLLRIALSALLLYSIGGVFHGYISHFIEIDQLFFPSEVIVWVTIYFVIAYIQLYLPVSAANRRLNAILAIVSFCGLLGSIFLTNTVGLHIPAFDNMLLAGNTAANPLVLLMIISLFNLSRSSEFHAKSINYVARLSLFIYIIHENLLLREYCRPRFWKYILAHFGDSHILLSALILSTIIFLFSLLSSMIYYHTIHKLVALLCKKIYPKVGRIIRTLEHKMLRIS